LCGGAFIAPLMKLGLAWAAARQDSRFDGAGFRAGRPLGAGTASASECAMSPRAAGSRRAGCVQCEPTSLDRSLAPRKEHYPTEDFLNAKTVQRCR